MGEEVMVEIPRFDTQWKVAPTDTYGKLPTAEQSRETKQMQSQEGPMQYYEGFYYTLQNNGNGTWTWRVYDATQVTLMQEGTVQADAHEWAIPAASAQDWIDVQNEGDIGPAPWDDVPIDPGLDVPGCMDPDALNYDSSATIDDGSCEYKDEGGGAPKLEFAFLGFIGFAILAWVFLADGGD